MEPLTILKLVDTGLILLDKGLALKDDIVPLMRNVTQQERPVTRQDIDALKALIAKQSAELQAESPPEEE